VPTVVKVDMLDSNVLATAVTKPPKNLDLYRIGSQQPSRCRPKRNDPPLASASTGQPSQDTHGG
jgi:hypothetical protein